MTPDGRCPPSLGSALTREIAIRAATTGAEDGQRLGDIVARTGSGAADLLGKVAEGAGGVVGMTLRTGGQLTAMTAGAVIGGADIVAYKVAPGLGEPNGDGDTTIELAQQKATPAKKSSARAGSRKSGSTRRRPARITRFG